MSSTATVTDQGAQLLSGGRSALITMQLAAAIYPGGLLLCGRRSWALVLTQLAAAIYPGGLLLCGRRSWALLQQLDVRSECGCYR